MLIPDFTRGFDGASTPPVSSNSSGRIVATDPAGHRRAHQPASDATIASSSTR